MQRNHTRIMESWFTQAKAASSNPGDANLKAHFIRLQSQILSGLDDPQAGAEVLMYFLRESSNKAPNPLFACISDEVAFDLISPVLRHPKIASMVAVLLQQQDIPGNFLFSNAITKMIERKTAAGDAPVANSFDPSQYISFFLECCFSKTVDLNTVTDGKGLLGKIFETRGLTTAQLERLLPSIAACITDARFKLQVAAFPARKGCATLDDWLTAIMVDIGADKGYSKRQSLKRELAAYCKCRWESELYYSKAILAAKPEQLMERQVTDPLYLSATGYLAGAALEQACALNPHIVLGLAAELVERAKDLLPQFGADAVQQMIAPYQKFVDEVAANLADENRDLVGDVESYFAKFSLSPNADNDCASQMVAATFREIAACGEDVEDEKLLHDALGKFADVFYATIKKREGSIGRGQRIKELLTDMAAKMPADRVDVARSQIEDCDFSKDDSIRGLIKLLDEQRFFDGLPQEGGREAIGVMFDRPVIIGGLAYGNRARHVREFLDSIAPDVAMSRDVTLMIGYDVACRRNAQEMAVDGPRVGDDVANQPVLARVLFGGGSGHARAVTYFENWFAEHDFDDFDSTKSLFDFLTHEAFYDVKESGEYSRSHPTSAGHGMIAAARRALVNQGLLAKAFTTLGMQQLSNADKQQELEGHQFLTHMVKSFDSDELDVAVARGHVRDIEWIMRNSVPRDEHGNIVKTGVVWQDTKQHPAGHGQVLRLLPAAEPGNVIPLNELFNGRPKLRGQQFCSLLQSLLALRSDVIDHYLVDIYRCNRVYRLSLHQESPLRELWDQLLARQEYENVALQADQYRLTSEAEVKGARGPRFLEPERIVASVPDDEGMRERIRNVLRIVNGGHIRATGAFMECLGAEDFYSLEFNEAFAEIVLRLDDSDLSATPQPELLFVYAEAIRELLARPTVDKQRLDDSTGEFFHHVLNNVADMAPAMSRDALIQRLDVYTGVFFHHVLHHVADMPPSTSRDSLIQRTAVNSGLWSAKDSKGRRVLMGVLSKLAMRGDVRTLQVFIENFAGVLDNAVLEGVAIHCGGDQSVIDTVTQALSTINEKRSAKGQKPLSCRYTVEKDICVRHSPKLMRAPLKQPESTQDEAAARKQELEKLYPCMAVRQQAIDSQHFDSHSPIKPYVDALKKGDKAFIGLLQDSDNVSKVHAIASKEGFDLRTLVAAYSKPECFATLKRCWGRIDAATPDLREDRELILDRNTHLGSPFHFAIDGSNQVMVSYLANQEILGIAVDDVDQNNPLHLAILKEDVDSLRSLIGGLLRYGNSELIAEVLLHRNSAGKSALAEGFSNPETAIIMTDFLRDCTTDHLKVLSVEEAFGKSLLEMASNKAFGPEKLLNLVKSLELKIEKGTEGGNQGVVARTVRKFAPRFVVDAFNKLNNYLNQPQGWNIGALRDAKGHSWLATAVENAGLETLDKLIKYMGSCVPTLPDDLYPLIIKAAVSNPNTTSSHLFDVTRCFTEKDEHDYVTLLDAFANYQYPGGKNLLHIAIEKDNDHFLHNFVFNATQAQSRLVSVVDVPRAARGRPYLDNDSLVSPEKKREFFYLLDEPDNEGVTPLELMFERVVERSDMEPLMLLSTVWFEARDATGELGIVGDNPALAKVIARHPFLASALTQAGEGSVDLAVNALFPWLSQRGSNAHNAFVRSPKVTGRGMVRLMGECLRNESAVMNWMKQLEYPVAYDPSGGASVAGPGGHFSSRERRLQLAHFLFRPFVGMRGELADNREPLCWATDGVGSDSDCGSYNVLDVVNADGLPAASKQSLLKIMLSCSENVVQDIDNVVWEEVLAPDLVNSILDLGYDVFNPPQSHRGGITQPLNAQESAYLKALFVERINVLRANSVGNPAAAEQLQVLYTDCLIKQPSLARAIQVHQRVQEIQDDNALFNCLLNFIESGKGDLSELVAPEKVVGTFHLLFSEKYLPLYRERLVGILEGEGSPSSVAFMQLFYSIFGEEGVDKERDASRPIRGELYARLAGLLVEAKNAQEMQRLANFRSDSLEPFLLHSDSGVGFFQRNRINKKIVSLLASRGSDLYPSLRRWSDDVETTQYRRKTGIGLNPSWISLLDDCNSVLKTLPYTPNDVDFYSPGALSEIVERVSQSKPSLSAPVIVTEGDKGPSEKLRRSQGDLYSDLSNDTVRGIPSLSPAEASLICNSPTSPFSSVTNIENVVSDSSIPFDKVIDCAKLANLCLVSDRDGRSAIRLLLQRFLLERRKASDIGDDTTVASLARQLEPVSVMLQESVPGLSSDELEAIQGILYGSHGDRVLERMQTPFMKVREKFSIAGDQLASVLDAPFNIGADQFKIAMDKSLNSVLKVSNELPKFGQRCILGAFNIFMQGYIEQIHVDGNGVEAQQRLARLKLMLADQRFRKALVLADSKGETVLHTICSQLVSYDSSKTQSASGGLIKLLMQYEEFCEMLPKQDTYGETPIHKLMGLNNGLDLMKSAVFSHKSNDQRFEQISKVSLLSTAAVMGDAEWMDYICGKQNKAGNFFDVNTIDAWGNCALFNVTSVGALNLLCQRGARLDVVDAEGRNVLQRHLQRVLDGGCELDPEMVRHLVFMGVDLAKEDHNSRCALDLIQEISNRANLARDRYDQMIATVRGDLEPKEMRGIAAAADQEFLRACRIGDYDTIAKLIPAYLNDAEYSEFECFILDKIIDVTEPLSHPESLERNVRDGIRERVSVENAMARNSKRKDASVSINGGVVHLQVYADQGKFDCFKTLNKMMHESIPEGVVESQFDRMVGSSLQRRVLPIKPHSYAVSIVDKVDSGSDQKVRYDTCMVQEIGKKRNYIVEEGSIKLTLRGDNQLRPIEIEVFHDGHIEVVGSGGGIFGSIMGLTKKSVGVNSEGKVPYQKAKDYCEGLESIYLGGIPLVQAVHEMRWRRSRVVRDPREYGNKHPECTLAPSLPGVALDAAESDLGLSSSQDVDSLWPDQTIPMAMGGVRGAAPVDSRRDNMPQPPSAFATEAQRDASSAGSVASLESAGDDMSVDSRRDNMPHPLSSFATEEQRDASSAGFAVSTDADLQSLRACVKPVTDALAKMLALIQPRDLVAAEDQVCIENPADGGAVFVLQAAAFPMEAKVLELETGSLRDRLFDAVKPVCTTLADLISATANVPLLQENDASIAVGEDEVGDNPRTQLQEIVEMLDDTVPKRYEADDGTATLHEGNAPELSPEKRERIQTFASTVSWLTSGIREHAHAVVSGEHSIGNDVEDTLSRSWTDVTGDSATSEGNLSDSEGERDNVDGSHQSLFAPAARDELDASLIDLMRNVKQSAKALSDAVGDGGSGYTLCDSVEDITQSLSALMGRSKLDQGLMCGKTTANTILAACEQLEHLTANIISKISIGQHSDSMNHDAEILHNVQQLASTLECMLHMVISAYEESERLQVLEHLRDEITERASEIQQLTARGSAENDSDMQVHEKSERVLQCLSACVASLQRVFSKEEEAAAPLSQCPRVSAGVLDAANILSEVMRDLLLQASAGLSQDASAQPPAGGPLQEGPAQDGAAISASAISADMLNLHNKLNVIFNETSQERGEPVPNASGQDDALGFANMLVKHLAPVMDDLHAVMGKVSSYCDQSLHSSLSQEQDLRENLQEVSLKSNLQVIADYEHKTAESLSVLRDRLTILDQIVAAGRSGDVEAALIDYKADLKHIAGDIYVLMSKFEALSNALMRKGGSNQFPPRASVALYSCIAEICQRYDVIDAYQSRSNLVLESSMRSDVGDGLGSMADHPGPNILPGESLRSAVGAHSMLQPELETDMEESSMRSAVGAHNMLQPELETDMEASSMRSAVGAHSMLQPELATDMEASSMRSDVGDGLGSMADHPGPNILPGESLRSAVGEHGVLQPEPETAMEESSMRSAVGEHGMLQSEPDTAMEASSLRDDVYGQHSIQLRPKGALGRQGAPPEDRASLYGFDTIQTTWQPDALPRYASQAQGVGGANLEMFLYLALLGVGSDTAPGHNPAATELPQDRDDAQSLLDMLKADEPQLQSFEQDGYESFPVSLPKEGSLNNAATKSIGDFLRDSFSSDSEEEDPSQQSVSAPAAQEGVQVQASTNVADANSTMQSAEVQKSAAALAAQEGVQVQASTNVADANSTMQSAEVQQSAAEPAEDVNTQAEVVHDSVSSELSLLLVSLRGGDASLVDVMYLIKALHAKNSSGEGRVKSAATIMTLNEALEKRAEEASSSGNFDVADRYRQLFAKVSKLSDNHRNRHDSKPDEIAVSLKDISSSMEDIANASGQATGGAAEKETKSGVSPSQSRSAPGPNLDPASCTNLKSLGQALRTGGNATDFLTSIQGYVMSDKKNGELLLKAADLLIKTPAVQQQDGGGRRGFYQALSKQVSSWMNSEAAALAPPDQRLAQLSEKDEFVSDLGSIDQFFMNNSADRSSGHQGAKTHSSSGRA